MPYNWTYGVALSGLQFPMVTASGTYAKSYDTAQLSTVISKDGGVWTATSNKCSGIPGDGVYCISQLTAAEMQAYTWAMKITANSGCLDQTLLGINASSHLIYSDISGFAHSLDCSGANAILTAVSGLNTSNLIAQCSSIIGGISTPVTLVAGQTVYASGLNPILVAISGLKNDVSGITGMQTSVSSVPSGVWLEPFANRIVSTSGLNGVLAATSGLKTDVSAINGILNAVSGVVSGVVGINTADSVIHTSGTLAHDLKLMRWFTWQNWNVDKTYTPDRLYFWNGTNMSSYFELADDANNTTRTRGG